MKCHHLGIIKRTAQPFYWRYNKLKRRTDIRDLKWSTREKKIARAAYEKAYKAEMRQIHEAVYKKVKDFRDENDVWRLHDYLTQKRREVDRKYDYRYSVLIFVFARLYREGLIRDEDLEGLSEEKITKIKRVSEF